jgi:hypothetical protein
MKSKITSEIQKSMQEQDDLDQEKQDLTMFLAKVN